MPYPDLTTYPALDIYPGSTDEGTRRPRLVIRERPPLRLAIDIAAPDGHHARWGADERDPANLPGADLGFSSTMPGGFEQLAVTLARKPGRDYPDLTEFSTLTAYGAGGDTAWQGRLETAPRTSGANLAIVPGAVGWQSALNDDNTARMIYIDVSQSGWQGPSVARRLGLLSAWDFEDPSSTTDPSGGEPSVLAQLTGTWSRARACEAWYDARGIALGALYFAWAKGSTVDTADTNWQWFAALDDDDIGTAHDLSTLYRAAGPTSDVLPATTATRKWARVRIQYGTTAGGGIAQGDQYPTYWTFLGVVGDHGLPIQGTLTTTGGIGLLASDIVGHAVRSWAPELATSFAGESTITPTTFAIEQLTFLDPSTAASIITQATRFGLEDWAVWDSPSGPVFWMHPRGARGKAWRARVGPATLQETGPQVDRIFNGVIVQYTDVTGITRTVGPPGSGASVEDSSLQDSDPENPASLAGLRRWTMLNMSVSTVAGATAIGAIFLAEQKLLSTAGQADLVGHVEDDRGVLWPAWKVRAGDTIRFVDAADPGDRRIVRATYSDAIKTCTVTLDSPPDGLSALLQRLSVSLVSLGLS